MEEEEEELEEEEEEEEDEDEVEVLDFLAAVLSFLAALLFFAGMFKLFVSIDTVYQCILCKPALSSHKTNFNYLALLVRSTGRVVFLPYCVYAS